MVTPKSVSIKNLPQYLQNTLCPISNAVQDIWFWVQQYYWCFSVFLVTSKATHTTPMLRNETWWLVLKIVSSYNMQCEMQQVDLLVCTTKVTHCPGGSCCWHQFDVTFHIHIYLHIVVYLILVLSTSVSCLTKFSQILLNVGGYFAIINQSAFIYDASTGNASAELSK